MEARDVRTVGVVGCGLMGSGIVEVVARIGIDVVYLEPSDGLVEAHNTKREMFSFGRLQNLVAEHAGGAALIEFLLGELAAFTGPGWEQEDDVTLIIARRTPLAR